MAETRNTDTTSAETLSAGMQIEAKDIYTKKEVNNLIEDPTYNTPSACVGYGLDVLGGY